MNLYEKVERFVKESSPKDSKHARRTIFWVKKIYPQADEAMLIAAITHDIERAFRKNKLEGIRDNEKGFLDKKHMEYHQKKGSEIVGNFLDEQGTNKEFIKRVKMLVSKHEFGGNEEQNILKDADSISFFENSVDYFIEVIAVKIDKEKVKAKFDWMFNRISSDEAKQIVRPWYEKAIKRLTEV